MTINNLSIPYPDFRLHEIIQPDEFDINNGSIVDKINQVLLILNQITDSVETGSGADLIDIKPVSPFVSTKIQAYLNEIVNRLKSNSATNSGASLIGAPAITTLTGLTVADQLSALKTLLDIEKIRITTAEGRIGSVETTNANQQTKINYHGQRIPIIEQGISGLSESVSLLDLKKAEKKDVYSKIENNATHDSLRAGIKNSAILITSIESQLAALNNTFSTDAERVAAIQEVMAAYKLADGEMSQLILNKADKATTYTKTEINDMQMGFFRVTDFDKHYVLAIDSAEVPIGIPEFAPVTDSLEVYVGGMLQAKTVDYIIHGQEVVNLNGSWDPGTRFDFRVRKNQRIYSAIENANLNKAISDSGTALAKAVDALLKADTALPLAQSSKVESAQALGTANSALSNSASAVSTSGLANTKSDNAVQTANDAKTLAQASDLRSRSASDVATAALTSASGTTQVAIDADKKATEALNVARSANSKSDLTTARIDNLVLKPGESNAEIIDAKVRHDGTLAANIGGHIRELGKQLAQTERQTSTLTQGVSVVNGEVNTPASVEIEGRTLVGLGNSQLETGKKYVLADKKTKVIVDGVTHSGVAKINKTGATGRAAIVRVANFEGKVAGSVVENPHTTTYKSGAVNTLPTPTQTNQEFQSSALSYISTLNGIAYDTPKTSAGDIAHQIFSFNIIEEVERNIGRIPRTTVADKVAWLKTNLARLVVNWHGFGSSVGGNKATLEAWDGVGSWSASTSHVIGSVTRISIVTALSRIDANGIIHYLAHVPASDGVIPSVINTDYIELEIELKPDADFTNPKVALYEVADADYNKILVDWNADEVVKRYPVVQGVQHVQGVSVVAEGDNLLPPFNEWVLHANARVVSPYELELNATGTFQKTFVIVNVAGGQSINLSGITNGRAAIVWKDKNNINLTDGYLTGGSSTFGNGTLQNRTFAIPTNAVTAEMIFDNITSSGLFTFKNPMLTLGSVAKPFVSRNPSSIIADVKLGAIGAAKDMLYEQDGRWLLRKAVEKDVVLDGSGAWVHFENYVGFKRFNGGTYTDALTGVYPRTTKYDGKSLATNGVLKETPDLTYIIIQVLTITVRNADTGFGETSTPTATDIKRYFNGWKYSDGTTWTSVTGNGQTATAQVALDTKPTDYTPYKLSYVLATPQVIDVTDKVEGALKVNGLTQVEVMSGVIRREKVVPIRHLTSLDWYINEKGVTGAVTDNPLKNKIGKFLSVNKNGQPDTGWVFVNNLVNQNGQYFATIKKEQFDPTAEYTVTYTALDKLKITANPTNVKLIYTNNMRSALDDTVTKQQDNSTMLSIHEKAILDMYIRIKALEVKP